MSSGLDPSTSPSLSRAIVVLLTNAVNLPINLTKPSGLVVNWCSMGSILTGLRRTHGSDLEKVRILEDSQVFKGAAAGVTGLVAQFRLDTQ